MSVDVEGLAGRVAAALPGSTPLERAELAAALMRAVYDHVKFRQPEGQGLDGREGPERRALAAVVDAAETHLAAVQVGAFGPGGLTGRPVTGFN